MRKPDSEELRRRFTYHPPQPDQIPRYEELRARCGDLAEAVVNLTPASREQSLALTHLEQVAFYANAAIARREDPEPDGQSEAPPDGAGDEKPASSGE